MKLVTEVGELALPADFQFEIEENNPFYSESGTQSIPTTLPCMSDTIKKFNYSNRPGMKNRFVRKFPAKLIAGSIHKDGQLVIDSSSPAGITGAIMLNESDFYSQVKDVKLEEIFSKIVRDDFTKSQDKITAWYNHLFSVYKGEVKDDFAVFPIAVNKTEEGKYTILNEPDFESSDAVAPLKFQARHVIYNGETASAPAGFGITPFLYLYRVIELIFAEYGYTINTNPFKTESPLNKIVLINNCADVICKGVVKYDQLVPSCTVSEFLEFLLNRFHATPFIVPERRQVDIVLFEDMLSSVPDSDLSKNCLKGYEITYMDRKALKLIEDTSIEGAAPAADSLEKFVEKYPVIGSEETIDKANMILQKATGEYFEILREEGSAAFVKRSVGRDNFNILSSEKYDAEEISAKDPCAAMLSLDKGWSGTERLMLVVPYTGDAIYLNTAYNNEEIERSDQQIIICYTAGKAANKLAVNDLRYYYGTTQMYNNQGEKWCEYSLTYKSLYPRFWEKYATLLLNQNVKFSAEIKYSVEQILNFKLSRLKLFQGVLVIVTKRNITMGDVISPGKTEMFSTRLYEPVEKYVLPTSESQFYYWVGKNDVWEILAQFEGQEWLEATWEYESGAPDPGYLPPPTREQFETGGKYYLTTTWVIITAKRLGGEIHTQREMIHTWYEPAKI